MKNNGVKFGLILAGVSIILSLVLYLLEIKSTSILIGILTFGISIGIIAYAGILERNENGGFITWKKALRVMFIVSIIGFVIGTIYQIGFAKFVDPNIEIEQKEAQIKVLESLRGSMGDERTEEEIEKIRNNSIYSIKNIFAMICGSILISFFISAILALIIRREKPGDIFEKYA